MRMKNILTADESAAASLWRDRRRLTRISSSRKPSVGEHAQEPTSFVARRAGGLAKADAFAVNLCVLCVSVVK